MATFSQAYTIGPADIVVDLDADGRPAISASGPPLAHNADHCQQALNARTVDFVDLPRFADLLCIFADQVQAAEDALWQIAQDSVDTAIGAQLEGFGAIVGAERQGLSDASYRNLIRATVKANRSRGTTEDLYEIAMLFIGSSAAGDIRIDLRPPASITVWTDTSASFSGGRVLNRLLQRSKAAGVRLVFIESVLDVPEYLRFCSASGPLHGVQVTGIGLDSASAPGTSTSLAAVAYDEDTTS